MVMIKDTFVIRDEKLNTEAMPGRGVHTTIIF